MVYTSPDYLQPLSTTTPLPPATLAAIQEIEQQFALPTEKLQEIVDRFLWEFEHGLASSENSHTFLPMIPTYVQHVPVGTESGTYLALDLGGTNLRVCQVVLDGKGKYTMKQEKYKVTDELKTGEVLDLFDYIAESVDHFVKNIGDGKKGETLSLGFTFSFPVQQTALDKGTLITWTKGFECKNAVGKDIVQLLQTALDKKSVPVKCTALVNDTAGTLMADAYATGDCLVGAIFGTGTNGAYVESVEKITKMKSTANEAKSKGLEKMIINTEWGAFDNNRQVIPITHFDSRVDRISVNPRLQIFEKMISGMYLGEVTRNVILYLVDSQLIFEGHSSKQLNQHYGLDTAIMSGLEASSVSTSSAASDPIASIRKVIVNDFQIKESLIKDSDCIAVARVSEIVGTRGARLSACALAACVRQTGHDVQGSTKRAKFGADGSLVEFYPRYSERIFKALEEVLGSEVAGRCEMSHAKDGSGIGAALCAQAAEKLAEAGM